MIKMEKQQALDFFSTFYGGEHHIPSEIKPFGFGWSVFHHGDLSSYDCDFLTRLIFLAHDKAIRASVMPRGPRGIQITIWQRGREGKISERHPTIAEALRDWRERHPSEVSA